MRETGRRTPLVQTSSAVIHEPPTRRDVVAEALTAYTLAWSADHVRWGPVWASFATAFTTLFFLSLLGAAIGLPVYPGSGARANGIGAIWWSAIIGIVSFLVGPWVAGALSRWSDLPLGRTEWRVRIHGRPANQFLSRRRRRRLAPRAVRSVGRHLWHPSVSCHEDRTRPASECAFGCAVVGVDRPGGGAGRRGGRRGIGEPVPPLAGMALSSPTRRMAGSTS